ncbi:MAG: hypothetical protein GY943_14225 [Chloroflexi bacterium]|nr:hypothetical protein [Chloroflexota bacterium]
MYIPAPPGDEPPGSFYKGRWPVFSPTGFVFESGGLSPHRTKTAVYALSLQLSSLVLQQKTLA